MGLFRKQVLLSSRQEGFLAFLEASLPAGKMMHLHDELMLCLDVKEAVAQDKKYRMAINISYGAKWCDWESAAPFYCYLAGQMFAALQYFLSRAAKSRAVDMDFHMVVFSCRYSHGPH
jgi:hypothetical protein